MNQKFADITEIGKTVMAILDHDPDPDTKVDTGGDTFPPSKYYLFFKRIAEKYKFRHAVVLGVCGGGDCFHLCKGNPDGIVSGVDIAYDHPAQIEYITKRHPNFQFWLGDSVKAAPILFQANGPIDFLFIDTTHVLDATVAEWEAWKPYLVDGAVVCFDDLFRTEMAGVWEGLPEPKVRLDLLHDGSPDVGGGFGFLIYRRET